MRIESYTSIRRADVELGDLTVLIGPNGAGKSNFIAAFGPLVYIADGRLALEVGRAGEPAHFCALLRARGTG